MGKTANTKYAAQMIAEHIQGWIPMKATDPYSQHEITQLRNLQSFDNVLAMMVLLMHPLSRDLVKFQPSYTHPTGTYGLLSSGVSTWLRSCLLSIPLQANTWLVYNLPTGLSDRTYNSWLKALAIPDAQKAVLQTNIKKAEEWWANRTSSAVDTVQKVAIMMGISPSASSKEEVDVILIKILTTAITMTC
jgi:hypothetical protein